MTGLSGRVEKLEAAGNPQRSLPLIVRHPDETEEQARQRWQGQHPGEDLYAAGAVLMVRLVSAQTRSEATR
jgi:hypothetical protein